MTGAVNLNKDFALAAREAWGPDLPDWIEELAKEATRTSATAAAKRIGKSVGLVSNVIHNKYGADLAGVEGVVRGALMGAMVMCPVLDEISRDRCLREQRMPFSATSEVRSRLYHACRGDCPHSRIKGGSHGQ